MKVDKTGKETLEIMRSVPWYNMWLFSFIEEYLHGNILEVGSGIGNFTMLLSKKGSVFATDIQTNYLKYLKKKFGKKVMVGYADIEKAKYFFKNESFDSIVCMNVLEHIENDDAALKNMFSLLKKGGRLFLLVPAHAISYGSLDVKLGHYRRYEKTQLVEKLKLSGFRKTKIRYLNSIAIFGWFINSRVFKKNIISKTQLSVFDKVARPVLLLEKIFPFPFGLSLLAVCWKK